MTIKAVSKKVKPVVVAPKNGKGSLLEQAVITNPHKVSEFGWDREFADAVSSEFGSLLTDTMTCQDLAALWQKYVPFAGHKRLARQFVQKFRISGGDGK